jgi:hypothetical protein
MFQSHVFKWSHGCIVFLQRYRWVIVIAWLFVLAVTVFDIRWAVRHIDTIMIWESNPIMRWVIKQFGMWIAGIARLGTVVFAMGLMPIAPRRCQITATFALVSVHAYLAGAYAVILWHNDPLIGL